MESEADKPSETPDEVPRHSIWSAIPKRTFGRVVILLALLVGILYLRERTPSIAGCMSNAFSVLPPTPTHSSPRELRARIEVWRDASPPSTP
jgi:hypothetical protein